MKTAIHILVTVLLSIASYAGMRLVTGWYLDIQDHRACTDTCFPCRVDFVTASGKCMCGGCRDLEVE